MKKLFNNINPISLMAILAFAMLFLATTTVLAVDNPQNGGIGMQGTISAPAPTQAPTISSPGNGAVFTTLPITVNGMCPNDLLVKLFKNNVFSGSVMCKNGSYSIQIDLFSSRNDLVARAFDDLDQSSPDSNLVSVTFNDSTTRPDVSTRVSLTSNYARRGANPKEVLTWPIIVSGGVPPYAISVDWGDGTTADVYTQTTPGELSIKHEYGQSGVYRALVKASDKNGIIAYLQITAIGNGEVKQSNVAGASADKITTPGKTVVLWQPAAIALPMIVSTFWLGKKYELKRIKSRLARGEQPFGN